jgi:hypothetical protein
MCTRRSVTRRIWLLRRWWFEGKTKGSVMGLEGLSWAPFRTTRGTRLYIAVTLPALTLRTIKDTTVSRGRQMARTGSNGQHGGAFHFVSTLFSLRKQEFAKCSTFPWYQRHPLTSLGHQECVISCLRRSSNACRNLG